MYYFYFDASALVKRYTQEIGSDKVNFLFNNVPLNRMMCLILGIIDILDLREEEKFHESRFFSGRS